MTVEQRVLEEFSDACVRQSRKGMAKYGHLLDMDPGRDSFQWGVEEVVDMLRYFTEDHMKLTERVKLLEMENEQLKAKIEHLEAVHDDEWRAKYQNT